MNTRWMAEHYGSGGSMDNPTDLFEIVTECGSKRIAEAVDAKDAMLIAAAPELLSALRSAVAVIESVGADASRQRAAIRKAGVEA